jgi:hypothetical protein
VDSGSWKVGLEAHSFVGMQYDKDPDCLPIREKVGLRMDRRMKKGRLEVFRFEQNKEK